MVISYHGHLYGRTTLNPCPLLSLLSKYYSILFDFIYFNNSIMYSWTYLSKNNHVLLD